MPTSSKLATTAVLLILTACGGGEREGSGGSPVDAETSFAAYAQELYRELEETPLSDTVQVDIGMFGDLSAMAGEHVVMGRYRYRIDSTQAGVSGHLTFFARSPAGSEAVPVVLAFDAGEGSWVLRDASYVPSGAGSAETSTVEQILDARLEAWAADAASAAVSSVRVFP